MPYFILNTRDPNILAVFWLLGMMPPFYILRKSDRLDEGKSYAYIFNAWIEIRGVQQLRLLDEPGRWRVEITKTSEAKWEDIEKELFTDEIMHWNKLDVPRNADVYHPFDMK